jgi:intein-encoded DNA endonuclease-like protein
MEPVQWRKSGSEEMTEISKEFMAGWLRGFFDGEGSVFFKTESRNGIRHTNRYLTVGNTDIVLMSTVSCYLN